MIDTSVFIRTRPLYHSYLENSTNNQSNDMYEHLNLSSSSSSFNTNTNSNSYFPLKKKHEDPDAKLK